jgi:general secretion pathway protein K
MRRRQAGIALITVMLVVALAVIITSQMIERLQLQMQRSANIQFNEQAYWYAMGAERFASSVLQQVNKTEPDVTHLAQLWAQGETSYPVEHGQISGEIKDLQACFNLNALKVSSTGSASSTAGVVGSKTLAQQALQTLITELSIENVGAFEAEYMVDALVDWLDEDSGIASAGGAEDNDYAAREFPYLPANNFLASINELRLIEHFTVPVINKLKDYVCVLPESNVLKINVNTIAEDKADIVSAILGTGVSLADVQQVLAARPDQGFAKVEDFFASKEFSKRNIDDNAKQYFGVDSDYFSLIANTKFANSFFTLRSVMKVNNNQQVQVISRTIGTE